MRWIIVDIGNIDAEYLPNNDLKGLYFSNLVGQLKGSGALALVLQDKNELLHCI